MSIWAKNLEKSQKSLKKNQIEKFLSKKNAFLLVLPNVETSLWPELSGPAPFRIQGDTLSVTEDGRTEEILVSNIG